MSKTTTPPSKQGVTLAREQVAEMNLRFFEGESIKRLMVDYKLNPEGLAVLLYERRRFRNYNLNNSSFEDYLLLREEAGLDDNAIMNRLNITRETIKNNHKKLAGTYIAKQHKPFPEPKKQRAVSLPKEERAALKDCVLLMLDWGYPAVEIGSIVGTGRQTIHEYKYRAKKEGTHTFNKQQMEQHRTVRANNRKRGDHMDIYYRHMKDGKVWGLTKLIDHLVHVEYVDPTPAMEKYMEWMKALAAPAPHPSGLSPLEQYAKSRPELIQQVKEVHDQKEATKRAKPMIPRRVSNDQEIGQYTQELAERIKDNLDKKPARKKEPSKTVDAIWQVKEDVVVRQRPPGRLKRGLLWLLGYTVEETKGKPDKE